MAAASEFSANVMSIRSDIKTFAADHSEVDFWQPDRLYLMGIHVDETGLAVDHFTLSSKLIKRHAVSLNGGDHGRHLIEIAMKLLEG